MKKIISILVSGFWLLASEVFSQDVHFAQLNETPLLLNPALTGVYDGFYRGIINYRNQWPSMGKPYSTFMASFDAPLAKKYKGGYFGLGAYLYSDKAGDSKFGTTQANLSVSTILPTNNSGGRVSFGLLAGFVQKSLSLDGIQWPNQYNGYNYDAGITPNESLGKHSFSYVDVGAGMNYETVKRTSTIDGSNTNRFVIGGSFSHATFPLQKFSPGSTERLYWKATAHTTIRRDIPGTKVGIVPSAIFMLQGPAYEVNLGMLVRYKINEGTKFTGFYTESAFSAGLHYRFKDAISPQVYFEFSDYAFGLSYDFNVSSYGEVKKSAGGLEISIKYANMRGALRKK